MSVFTKANTLLDADFTTLVIRVSINKYDTDLFIWVWEYAIYQDTHFNAVAE